MADKDFTEADVCGFELNCSNSSSSEARNQEPTASETRRERDDTERHLQHRIPFNRDDLYYDMSGERILVIFNHQIYEETFLGRQRPEERIGTDEDVTSLRDTFTKLKFTTTVLHNPRHADIIRQVKKVCDKDHRGTSVIAIAILTHGDVNNTVFAADRTYQLSDVTNLLQNSPSLVGKPKLLFVQACRGHGLDEGKSVQTDGQVSIVLPTHADSLITLASAEKHYAYRESNGTWLMQALCEVLEKRHEELDLLQMITLVNQIVANKVTCTLDERTNKKKMIPETKFTLTKLIKF